MKADFHIHTNFSDGAFSPEKIVDTAVDIGLEAIALTDHDNVLSHDYAIKHVDELSFGKSKKVLEIIPGVEINTLYKGYEIHILGYFMDKTNSDFLKMIKMQQNARIKQTKEIITLLNKKAGIKIKFEDIKKLTAEGGSIGRPHIAKAITIKKGTGSVIESYAKYIHEGSEVYIPRKTVTPHDAVEVIYHAGGVPVFAHPFDVEIAEQMVDELMQCGLRGIEAYHRKHSSAMVEYYSSMAEKNGLIVTGGSDFHAPKPNNGAIIMGKNFIPEWIYDQLVTEKKHLDLA